MSGGVKPSVVQTSEDTSDPAEFLLSNSKYHDCHLTVGDASTGQVETIGISSTHLIAHSPVFRHMLAESELADPSGSNTHITDVSPATFKLMLRYVYGAKLPKMTPEVVLELVLCADKYNIQRLVRKAAKQLKPITVENVFPLLTCTTYIECPELILEVRKIVQQETDKILINPKFLQLDENCILFLVQQSLLNVSELELWNNVVRWGENQVKIQPEKTLRGCLDKALKHLRLLSLKSEEILENVLTKNVLTPEEILDLTCAVTKKQALKSSGLCKDVIKRECYKKPNESVVFSPSNVTLKNLGNKYFSHITIITTKRIRINTFKLKNKFSKPNNDESFRSFDITCDIVSTMSHDGIYVSNEAFKVKQVALPYQDLTVPILKSNYREWILKANARYDIEIQMNSPLPVHSLYCTYDRAKDLTCVWHNSYGMKLKYGDPCHVIEIKYEVLE